MPLEDGGAGASKVLRLIDALEDNDDVQGVYANFDIPEAVLEAAVTRSIPGRSGRNCVRRGFARHLLPAGPSEPVRTLLL